MRIVQLFLTSLIVVSLVILGINFDLDGQSQWTEPIEVETIVFKDNKFDRPKIKPIHFLKIQKPDLSRTTTIPTKSNNTRDAKILILDPYK